MPQNLYLLILEKRKEDICKRIDMLVYGVLGLCFTVPTTSTEPSYKPFSYQKARLYHPLEKGDSNSYVTRSTFQESPELLSAFDEVIMLQQRLANLDNVISENQILLAQRQYITAEHHFEFYRSMTLIAEVSDKLRSLKAEQSNGNISHTENLQINNKISALTVCLKFLWAKDPRQLAANSTVSSDLSSLTSSCFGLFSAPNHNGESLKACNYLTQQLAAFSSKEQGKAGYENARNNLIGNSRTCELVNRSIDRIRLAIVTYDSVRRRQQAEDDQHQQQAQQQPHCTYRV